MQPNRDGEIEMITQQVLKGCQWIIFSFSRGLLDSVTSKISSTVYRQRYNLTSGKTTSS